MFIGGVYWPTLEKDELLLNKLKKIIPPTKENLYFHHSSSLDFFSYLEHGNFVKNKNIIAIGRMFRKDSYETLSDNTIEKGNNNYFNVHNVANSYWGNYIFIKENPDDTIEILIDQTGQTSFFYTTLNNGAIVFSNELRFVLEMTDIKPNLNWDYLLNFLVYGNFISTSTAFKKVYELPIGYSLKISRESQKSSVIWDPIKVYKSNLNQNDHEASITRSLSNVCRQWIKPYNKIYLEFSGGLDSTSLLYTLKDVIEKDQELIAFNIFHPLVKTSNELAHAEVITKSTGINLMAFDCSDCLPLTPEKNNLNKLNKPSILYTYIRREEEISNLTKIDKNVLFINGHGGDAAFLGPPPISSLCDYILERGFKGLHSKMLEICHYYGHSLPYVIKEMLNNFSFYLFKSKYSSEFKSHYHAPWYIKKIDCLSNDDILHSSYNSFKGISPGKRTHMLGILGSLASINSNMKSKYNHTFYPFFTQPIIEKALSIPTYLSYEQDHDRYIFRKAISEHYSTPYVWRQDKGEASGIFQLGLRKNLKTVLELCLEGLMAKNNFVDKNILHKSILNMCDGPITYSWPLVHLFCLEKFLQSWRIA